MIASVWLTRRLRSIRSLDAGAGQAGQDSEHGNRHHQFDHRETARARQLCLSSAPPVTCSSKLPAYAPGRRSGLRQDDRRAGRCVPVLRGGGARRRGQRVPGCAGTGNGQRVVIADTRVRCANTREAGHGRGILWIHHAPTLLRQLARLQHVQASEGATCGHRTRTKAVPPWLIWRRSPPRSSARSVVKPRCARQWARG